MDTFSKTTTKDFNLFKTECGYWVEKFGLNDWRVNLDIGEVAGFATAEIYFIERFCHIVLSDELPDVNREKTIIETAFHEVFDGIVLAEIRTIAKNRDFDDDRLDSVCHGVLNRIQRLLLSTRRKDK